MQVNTYSVKYSRKAFGLIPIPTPTCAQPVCEDISEEKARAWSFSGCVHDIFALTRPLTQRRTERMAPGLPLA